MGYDSADQGWSEEYGQGYDFEQDDTVGEFENDSFDDSMDGDAESAFESCGWGLDESYGYYGDDGVEDFHADEAVGFVDYNEDGPYDD